MAQGLPFYLNLKSPVYFKPRSATDWVIIEPKDLPDDLKRDYKDPDKIYIEHQHFPITIEETPDKLTTYYCAIFVYKGNKFAQKVDKLPAPSPVVKPKEEEAPEEEAPEEEAPEEEFEESTEESVYSQEGDSDVFDIETEEDEAQNKQASILIKIASRIAN